MKKVRFLDEPKEENLKPIEFTRKLNIGSGFVATKEKPQKFDEIVYLGKCKKQGDLFMVRPNGICIIFKGHLNDGVY